MKSQLKTSEEYFREQIDRIRDECVNLRDPGTRRQQDSRVRREVTFKHDIQRLHLAIVDLVDRSGQQGAGLQKLVVEMEKSLKGAADTIQKLE